MKILLRARRAEYSKQPFPSHSTIKKIVSNSQKYRSAAYIAPIIQTMVKTPKFDLFTIYYLILFIRIHKSKKPHGNDEIFFPALVY